ncbi:kinase-like domain-containing protein [Lipomyces arxii]|uniref:kinase-like domain-containing protein n=1 Tax=Lipomyces arxii TaxID=56418 RepID=UPI0034CE24D1
MKKLAAFRDRAIAELSPSKSDSSSPTFNSPVTTVWTPEKELEELDDGDLQAEREMQAICRSNRKMSELADQLVEYRHRVSHKSPGMSLGSAVNTWNFNYYEKGEIFDFKVIFFGGTPNCPKIVSDMSLTTTNFGYDDDRGDYKIVPGDHLAYRYEILGLLGKGSFGQVVKCVDHKTSGLTAVKIIRNKKRFHAQALMETKILQNLCEWDPDDTHHFVRVTHSFYFRGHLCIATELLSLNLYEFVKMHEFKGLSVLLIRRFAKQILSSLCILQRKAVIHCDLKPENILLSTPESAEIKVIDFGSSCFEREQVFTYIQSRFYRSPEVILGLSYGLPIDMWSLGCILAELHVGYPILPGENEQEQLGCIMEVFGPPEPALIQKASRRKLFFDTNGRPRIVISAKGRRRVPSSKSLATVLRTDNAAFIDFIAKCLQWDAAKRLRPDDAVRHPFITGKLMPRPTSAGMSGSRVPSGSSFNASAVAAGHLRPLGGRPLPELPRTKLYSTSPYISVSTMQPRSPSGKYLNASAEGITMASGESSMAGSELTINVPHRFPHQPLLSPSERHPSSTNVPTMPPKLSSRLSISGGYSEAGSQASMSSVSRVASGSSSTSRLSSFATALPNESPRPSVVGRTRV